MSEYRISAVSAQRIVDEIGRLVGQNINMMNAEGYIIASTDEKRIGMFHKGAARIITEKLPELYISAMESTPTEKMGLNLPIIYEGEIVGVIGITGNYDEVIGYGKIVKKMTEIFVGENIEKDDKNFYSRVYNRFLESWIFEGGIGAGGKDLEMRGKTLGIDINIPRRIMIVSMKNPDIYLNSYDGQKLIRRVEGAIEAYVTQKADAIILRNMARQIILLPKCTSEYMKSHALCLRELVKKQCGVELCVGIDGDGEYSSIHKSYIQAETAWKSVRSGTEDILAYEDITLEMFMGEVSNETKISYIRKIFKDCVYEEICDWMEILKAYFRNEGSVNATAEMLYMHKNTLQYKLKKLEKITGYDVRVPSKIPIYYMAVLFFDQVGENLAIIDK